MKRLPGMIVLYCFCTFTAIGQKSLVIRGKIDNLPVGYIHFEYMGKDYNLVNDTIQIDSDGKYIHEIKNFPSAQRVNIYVGKSVATEVFVAPGFALTFSVDARNDTTFKKSKFIGGLDWGSNSFRKIMDSLARSKPPVSIYSLTGAAFISYLNGAVTTSDSLAARIFTNKAHESYAQEFASQVNFDNYMMKLYFLCYYINAGKVSSDSAKGFLTKNINLKQYSLFSSPKFLLSPVYIRTMTGNYLAYLVSQTGHPHSGIELLENQLEVIKKCYTGEIKKYTINEILGQQLQSCTSFEKLQIIDSLVSNKVLKDMPFDFRTEVAEMFNVKSKSLAANKTGQAAPFFQLANEQGKTYTLHDFKGKVVYIDLWASWCGPCRAESPFMEKIVTRFKNDTTVVFLSIAVKDQDADWRKALEKDKPSWLQLYDIQDLIYNAYHAVSIPRFVIVGKSGKIASFDAPRPSNENELIAILNEESRRIDM